MPYVLNIRVMYWLTLRRQKQALTHLELRKPGALQLEGKCLLHVKGLASPLVAAVKQPRPSNLSCAAGTKRLWSGACLCLATENLRKVYLPSTLITLKVGRSCLATLVLTGFHPRLLTCL